MRIAVLAGGLSHERDVSLRSGRRVVDALHRRPVDVEVWDVDAQFVDRLRRGDTDVAIIALHGGTGENGTVQSVLELAGTPHSGTPSQECRAAFDKAVAKTRLRDEGIATPEWVVLPSSAFRDLGAAALSQLVVDSLGLPVVVKPAAGGSALGVSLVAEPAQLAPALVEAYSYGSDALVERYVPGLEVTVPVLHLGGDFVDLHPVLVEAPAGGVYDYRARYDASSGVRYTHLDDDEPRVDVPALRRLATAVHTTLGLRDLSRVDIRCDDDGVPQVLEAAVTPGLTETSVWPLAVAAAGLDLGETFEALSRQALERHARR